MFIGSRKGHILHNDMCRYVKRIKEENCQKFQTMQEAVSCGYHICIFCSKTRKAFLKEKDRIDQFCKETGYTCKWKNEKIMIATPVDHWLIVYDWSKKKFLIYHENLKKWVTKNKCSSQSELSGYHKQHMTYYSVYDTLLSIYDHTMYYLHRGDISKEMKQKMRAKIYRSAPHVIPAPLSKRNRAKRVRKAKEINKKHQVGYVLDLIEYLAHKRNGTEV